jgi:CheY-like chemotaxis protein
MQEDDHCPLASDGSSPSTPVRRRLLVVDDNAAVRTTVRRLAQAWGFLCGEAPDGLAAWRCLECQRVSMVLTDHDMPRLDGLGLVTRLAARAAATGTPMVPVILISGNMSAGLAERALAAGARAFLWKPLQPALLREAIAELLPDGGDAQAPGVAKADAGAPVVGPIDR